MELLKYFPELLDTIEIHREVDTTDSWGNTDPQGNWQIDHTERGYIQPKQGEYVQNNQRETSLSSHVLYTLTDVDINTGDRVLYNGDFYRVEFDQKNGIGNTGDHIEFDLQILEDL